MRAPEPRPRGRTWHLAHQHRAKSQGQQTLPAYAMMRVCVIAAPSATARLRARCDAGCSARETEH
eukprot:1292539-Rhodomonas_salina.1